jgi:hypothetical protein
VIAPARILRTTSFTLFTSTAGHGNLYTEYWRFHHVAQTPF